jgi:hypothetical protein
MIVFWGNVIGYYETIIDASFVKNRNFGWSCKKLHMRGAENFIHSGVPGYVGINEDLQQRSR